MLALSVAPRQENTSKCGRAGGRERGRQEGGREGGREGGKEKWKPFTTHVGLCRMKYLYERREAIRVGTSSQP